MIRVENKSSKNWNEHTFYESGIGGIYMLYDLNDELIYIGQSKDVSLRIKQHNAQNIHEWKYAYVIPINHKEHRLFTESILIRYLQPKNNKTKCFPKWFEFDFKQLVELQSALVESSKKIDFMLNLRIDREYYKVVENLKE